MDLPETDGNSFILVILDHFSRLLCLLPMPKLPASFELAKLLFNRVFPYFGLPEDIVGNHGPQLPLKFGTAFWKNMGPQ